MFFKRSLAVLYFILLKITFFLNKLLVPDPIIMGPENIPANTKATLFIHFTE